MILVIDDDNAIRASLKLMFRRAGMECETAESPDEALKLIRVSTPELVVMDMNFSHATTGEEGLELLQKVKILRPEVPVILITAWGNIDLAVKGMRAGATDFITKPWNGHVLLERVKTAIELNTNINSQQSTPTKNRFPGIIGHSPALLKVLETVERIAPTNASVLILGENGTGKELIAEAIHRNSKRSTGPFIKVNLGGISQSLFESEMFGHRKGAFTGAVNDRDGRFKVAHNGTIFLDEIGDLDMASQVKLLRVLQEHTFEPLGDSRPVSVDIRVVSATNAPLSQMVADRKFREDLFYRLNLITITLPPLRERKEDIPLLINHFKSRIETDNGIKREFSPAAIKKLQSYSFPGNIRELKNMVERLILMSQSSIIEADDINLGDNNTESSDLESLERKAIVQALSQNGNNITSTANQLGLTRQSLYRKIEKLGITIPR